MENYLRVVRKVADNLGMTLREYDGGWNIVFVDRNGEEFSMLMFDIGLNTSLSVRKVSDKSRCYDILEEKGVDAVPHYFYMSPCHASNELSLSDALEEMRELLHSDGAVVVKANTGGAGRDVYLVNTESELEEVVLDLFNRDINVALSPYYDFETEYRLVVLDGEVQMSFGKKRGVDFKHNLSSGSVVVDVPDHLKESMDALAIDAAKAVGARFVSVDIIDHVEGLKVLEINGSVTLKRVAAASELWFDRCVATYTRALNKVIESHYEKVYSK